MANVRITDQTTDTLLVDGDYVIVDSQNEGTRKYNLGKGLAEIKEDLAEIEGGGLSDDAKAALLACFQNVAWIGTNGDDYYQDLYDALYPPAPPATLSYITCVYTQSGTVYDTDSLNDLKSDLVVTAHYSNGTTQTVTSYTLSGTLTEGTSTITVSYGGKTTTFNVVVSTRQTVVIPHIGEMGSDGFKGQEGDGTKNVFLYSGSTSGYYQLWSADVPQNSVVHLDFEEIYSANIYVAIIATGTLIDSSANGTYYPDIGTITQDFTSLSGNLDNSLSWETGSVTGSTACKFGLTDDAYFTMPITGKIVLGIRAASFKANSEQTSSTANLRNYVDNNNFSFYYI